MANTVKQQLTVIDITDDNTSTILPNMSKVGKNITIRSVVPKTTNNRSTPPTGGVVNTVPSTIAIPTDDNSFIEKRCENPDCAAPTLISLVPTRPIPQFIHNPTVVPEPILVNGYTTVFEVGGITAKVSELSTVKCVDGKIRYKSRKPIYRIVPNTHAHIVNYVIIDAEGETLRKIKQNDPATIKKLLESQKNSAEQLLEKLIGVKKTPPVKSITTRTTGTTTVPVTPTQPQRTLVKLPTMNTTVTVAPTVSSAPPLPTIQTPVIASVSSGVSEVIAVSGSVPPSQPQPVVTPAIPAIPTIQAQQAVSTTTALEKMQSELRELRETVKLLTEQKRASSGSADESGSKKQKTS